MSGPGPADPDEALRSLHQQVERERAARLEAEAVAERITRELYAKAQLVELLQRVAVGANEALTSDDALQVAVSQLCTSMGWPIGHVYRLATDGSGTYLPTDIWRYRLRRMLRIVMVAVAFVALASAVGAAPPLETAMALMANYHEDVSRLDRAREVVAEAREQLQRVLDEKAPTDVPRWTLREVPRARQLLRSLPGAGG